MARFSIHKKLFITCGSISSVGFCLYLTAKQKSIVLCSENDERDNENGTLLEIGHETSKDDETEINLQNVKNSDIWSVLFRFLKSDFVWFALSIPVLITQVL